MTDRLVKTWFKKNKNCTKKHFLTERLVKNKKEFITSDFLIRKNTIYLPNHWQSTKGITM